MEKTSNVKGFLWNAVASVVTSLLSAILLLLINRQFGSSYGGIFSIAFATATIINALGEHSIRIYQVTDTFHKFSFRTYLKSRYILTALMAVAALVMAIIYRQEPMKAFICAAVVAFRIVDDISDVYQGEFQIHHRLDLSSKTMVYRTLLSIIVFALLSFFLKNLAVAIIGLAVTNGIVFLLYDKVQIKKFAASKETEAVPFQSVWPLIKQCLPLMFATFLNLYIINAPKYAIDNYLNYELQNIFSIIYLPTFTISLLCLFIFKPLLNNLAKCWNQENKKDFCKIMVKLTIFILAATAFIEMVCYFVGLPILSFIYGVELAAYRTELLILILSGGFMSLSAMLFNALTTMRSQSKLSYCYLLAALSGLFLSNFFVKKLELMGAAYASLSISCILCASLLLMFFYEYFRKTNTKRHETKNL